VASAKLQTRTDRACMLGPKQPRCPFIYVGNTCRMGVRTQCS
jgi:hypothetical protein